MATPSSSSAKIPVTTIALRRRAGAVAEQTVTSFAAADTVLRAWARTAPATPNASDPVEFVVSYADGERYEGRYALNARDEAGADLSGHMVRGLRAYALSDSGADGVHEKDDFVERYATSDEPSLGPAPQPPATAAEAPAAEAPAEASAEPEAARERVLVIKGDTFPWRSRLNELGAAWNGRVWSADLEHREALEEFAASRRLRVVEMDRGELPEEQALDVLLISGKTYDARDELKAAGAWFVDNRWRRQWVAEARAWDEIAEVAKRHNLDVREASVPRRMVRSGPARMGRPGQDRGQERDAGRAARQAVPAPGRAAVPPDAAVKAPAAAKAPEPPRAEEGAPRSHAAKPAEAAGAAPAQGERQKYADGRMVPVSGDRVYAEAPGLGGMPAVMRGQVYSNRKGEMRVRVTESSSLTGGTVKEDARYPLDARWTVVGDPEPERQRQAAQAAKAEREAALLAEQRAAEAQARTAAGEAIARGEGGALTPETARVGLVIRSYEELWPGGFGVITDIDDEGRVYARGLDEEGAGGLIGGLDRFSVPGPQRERDVDARPATSSDEAEIAPAPLTPEPVPVAEVTVVSTPAEVALVSEPARSRVNQLPTRAGGLEVQFPGRPQREQLDQLKKAGFRYDGHNKLWWARWKAHREEVVLALAGEPGVKVGGVLESALPAAPATEESPAPAKSEARPVEARVEGGTAPGLMGFARLIASAREQEHAESAVSAASEGAPEPRVADQAVAPEIVATSEVISETAPADEAHVEHSGTTAAPEAPASAKVIRGTRGLMAEVGRRLEAGQAIDNPTLDRLAAEAFGGTRGQGAYTPRDAYDTAEAAVARWVVGNGARLLAGDEQAALAELRALTSLLPRQTDRTEEQIEFQQFSTPPTHAFVVTKAARIGAGDVVLEPSAGTASLAAWARAAGATVHVNEIAKRRLELLRELGFEPTRVNAEILHDVLPAEIRPTVVVMNPPFSATAGRVQRHRTEFGASHVRHALRRLEPGGRLVGIVGQGMTFAGEPGRAREATGAAFHEWWERVMDRYTVRANLRLPGDEYGKYGTTFANQLIIIDNTGPTPGRDFSERLSRVRWGTVQNLEEALDVVRAVELDRDLGRDSDRVPGPVREERGPVAGGSGVPGDRRPGVDVVGPDADLARGEGTDLPGAEPAAGRAEPVDRGRVRAGGGSAPDGGRGVAPEASPLPSFNRRSDRTSTEGPPSLNRKPDRTSTEGPPSLNRKPDRTSTENGPAPEPTPESEAGPAAPPVVAAPPTAAAPQETVEPSLPLLPAEPAPARAAEMVAPEGPAAEVPAQVAAAPVTAPVAAVTTELAPPSAEAADLPQAPPAAVVREDVSGGTFVRYAPTRLDTTGLRPHPSPIVEAAAMAAVEPPAIQYRSALPSEVLRERLSAIQYESVLYAGQRHSQRLPSGARGGYFVGDGTGVGKGRINAAIILDNWHQGRQRAVWFSASNDLMEAAIRDLNDVGAGDIPIRRVNEFSPADPIDIEAGIIFSTYSSLAASSRLADGGTRTRREQIEQWLKPEGVIVFDEAHKAKNALAAGRGEPTKTGLAVIDLQENLPDARVVYVSATGATDVRNMAYQTRLGLWGQGTAFPGGFPEFLGKIEAGGVGAMEMVARDLKALGMYCSRSLPFEGVEYREVIHELTPHQREMYNDLAEAWQVVLQNIDQAVKVTGGGATARRNAMTQFWAAQQRSFKQVITAMKVGAAIQESEAALAQGKSVVIGLIGTGESRTEEAVSRATREGESLDDLDFTPREVIASAVNRCFPTTLYQKVRHPSDPRKTIEVPVLDEHGTPVESREALAMKADLLARISDLRLPDNPLDQVVNHFGPERVSELTGRKRRLIRDKATGATEYVKRAPEGVAMARTNLYEMERFQSGQTRVAIISNAASTGISLHASNREENRQRRVHITLELGWSADTQLQTFGRTHRSDQAQPPEYVLLSTDVGGEKRFSSTIARRLASLGALTKGQRDAAGGEALAQYNFETREGGAALESLLVRMQCGGGVPGVGDSRGCLKDMGLMGRNGDTVADVDLRNVPRFLNRMLALDIERQNALFDEFVRTFERTVQRARDLGVFDSGVEDIKAEAIRLKDASVIHTDALTGAETHHYVLEVDRKTHPIAWDLVDGMVDKGAHHAFYKQNRSGRVVFAAPGANRTDGATGMVERTMVITTPRHSHDQALPESEFFDKYTKVDRDTARAAWQAALLEIPTVETRQRHIIGGAILPLWQRLESAGSKNLKVVRATTQDGRRVVGIDIPSAQLGCTLEAIGIHRSLCRPDEVFTAVLDEGATVRLVAGLYLRKASVHREDRIELGGADRYKAGELKSMGIFEEYLDYRFRYFVPTDEKKGVEVLDRLLERYPAMRPEPPEKVKAAEAAELHEAVAHVAARRPYPEVADAMVGAAADRNVSLADELAPDPASRTRDVPVRGREN